MLNAKPYSAARVRVQELHDAGKGVTEIAGLLQAEGYMTRRGGPWTRQKAWQIINIPLVTVKKTSCSSCGRPTTSETGVCTNPSCASEYHRATYQWRLRSGRLDDKEARNKSIRQRRALHQRAHVPSVYAIWFPVPQVLKVGFTSQKTDSPFVSAARTRAERHGLDPAGSSCIWRQPGDTRTEAWMQATLSFRWWPAFEQKHIRICEWLQIPDLPAADIVGVLDEVYGLVPADVRGDGLAAA